MMSEQQQQRQQQREKEKMRSGRRLGGGGEDWKRNADGQIKGIRDEVKKKKQQRFHIRPS